MASRIAAALFALGLAACASNAPALHGTVFSPPRPAPQFTLTDQHGQRFSLAAQRDAAVAVYFGYTHCKDVCPQTLALLGRARSLAGLTPERLRIVFVTVDPLRDTPAVLSQFLQRTGVRASALTGSAASLAAAYKAYGVDVEAQRREIGHTSAVFLIDPAGRLREVLDSSTPADAVAQDLRAVVD